MGAQQARGALLSAASAARRRPEVAGLQENHADSVE